MAPKKSLFSLKKFWLSITLPLLVSAIWATYIAGLWSDIPHNFWELAFEKLMNPDDALKGYKSPLAVAALVFPLVALVASHHRSVQTAEQIKASERKDGFENYYKHQEYFNTYINNIKIRQDIEFDFLNVYGLYKSIFPKNSMMKFEKFVVDDGILKIVMSNVNELIEIISKNNFNENDAERCFKMINFTMIFLKVNKIKILKEETSSKSRINPRTCILSFSTKSENMPSNSRSEFTKIK